MNVDALTPKTSRTRSICRNREAYDAALDILATHKLIGNFRVNLEIVRKDIGAFDKVTYEIKPKSKLPYYPDYPDCRHVVFRPNEHDVHMDKFNEIMRSIEARIQFRFQPFI